MRWEERLLREIDDLEQQAEGLHLAERDAVVAELSVSEFAEISLASRLHASVGAELRLVLRDGNGLEGVLTRAGRGWLLLRQERGETVVPLAAVARVRGGSRRSVPAAAHSVPARLGLGSVLRQLAASGEDVAVATWGGGLLRGRLRRVGADFVEVGADPVAFELVGFDALLHVRRG